MICKISIQQADFEIAREIDALAAGGRNIGALVSFVGLCRDEGGRLAALELEHYHGMAEKQIGAIVEDAAKRWHLDGVTVIHRYGLIKPGEHIVLVVTSSAHRRASFEAAEYMMDYLKTRAPFWKREHLATGEIGGWVEAHDADDAAMKRWSPA